MSNFINRKYSVKKVVIKCEECGILHSYSKDLCRLCSEKLFMRNMRNKGGTIITNKPSRKMIKSIE